MNAHPPSKPRTESVFGAVLVRGLAHWTQGAPGSWPLLDVDADVDATLLPWPVAGADEIERELEKSSQ